MTNLYKVPNLIWWSGHCVIYLCSYSCGRYLACYTALTRPTRSKQLTTVGTLPYRFLSCWCLARSTFLRSQISTCSLLNVCSFFGWLGLLQILRIPLAALSFAVLCRFYFYECKYAYFNQLTMLQFDLQIWFVVQQLAQKILWHTMTHKPADGWYIWCCVYKIHGRQIISITHAQAGVCIFDWRCYHLDSLTTIKQPKINAKYEKYPEITLYFLVPRMHCSYQSVKRKQKCKLASLKYTVIQTPSSFVTFPKIYLAKIWFDTLLITWLDVSWKEDFDR